MNLNPGARARHQIRVITVGFFRMLKSMVDFKVIYISISEWKNIQLDLVLKNLTNLKKKIYTFSDPQDENRDCYSHGVSCLVRED